MLGRLSKEAIGRLGSIRLTDLDRPVLNDVVGIRIKYGVPECSDALLSPLLECDEGKASRASIHFVAHDGHIHDFAKALEIRLYIGFCTNRGKEGG